MNILKRLFYKGKPTETEILNYGVNLAMEFGKNWLQPIQERLGKKYKFLTVTELDNYNTKCKEVKDNSHKFVIDTLANCEKKNSTISGTQLKESHRVFIISKYSWVTKDVIKSLYNQGLYYADKDGYYQFIK